ncbi:MAG: hypothetical protein ABIX01_24310 [Chitinophagaceae bacterium]
MNPYLQRHYDYQTPAPNQGSSPMLTLYCLQSEFTAFNASRGSSKSLPTAGSNSDPNIANIRVVFYAGLYPAGTILSFVPSSINWNAAHNWWEITFGTPSFGTISDGAGDYFIQSVFDCQPPPVSVSTISPTAATAFWNVIFGGSGFEYAVQTTNTAPAGAGTATSNTVVNLNGLIPNTNYYFFIRTNCGDGNFSSWASTNFFTAASATAKIGIGTNSPSSNLEIAGTGIPDIKISSTNSFGPSRVSFISDKGTATEWRPG